MQRQQRTIAHLGAIALALAMLVTLSAFASPVAAQDDDRFTVPLNERENSGVSGSATLAAAGEDTRVSMELSGDPVTGDHPTHIHTGTCADFDPDPLYPLTTVILDEVGDEGESDTTVEDVALDDLLDDDYVILVHESAEELYPEWVCGDIKADGGGGDGQTGAGEDDTGGTSEDAGPRGGEAAGARRVGEGAGAETGAGGTVRMPSSGVGAAAAGAAPAPLPVALGALAVLAAVAAGGLRLRRGGRG